MRPVMVPSKPVSVVMFAIDHSAAILVFTSGVTSTIVSSMAWATAASPR